MIRQLFYRGPAIDVLHEEYAKQGRIDTDAPVQAEVETIVAAPPERVFAVLSDPRRWAAALPTIHDVRLVGEPALDTRFTWSDGRTRLVSRYAVRHPGEVTWTGTTSGTHAVHRHELAPTPDGGTRIRCVESMGGPLISLFFPSAKLHRRLVTWLDGLKTVAERG